MSLTRTAVILMALLVAGTIWKASMPSSLVEESTASLEPLMQSDLDKVPQSPHATQPEVGGGSGEDQHHHQDGVQQSNVAVGTLGSRLTLGVNDGRLRCTKGLGACSDVSDWSRKSWFADARDATMDGAYLDTPILRAEQRAVDTDANVTTEDVWKEEHDAREWRVGWRLRYPNVRWQRGASTTRQERDTLTHDVLEERAKMHLRDAASSAHVGNLSDLDFISSVPPLYTYLRSNMSARWAAMDKAEGGRVVRVACLYAGFARNVEAMYASCHDRKSKKACANRYTNKQYGNQRDNIIEATQCDVYASTWNIRGAGRYDVNQYNMADVFDAKALHTLYGERLAGVHVQNISEYQQLWRYMHKHSRIFPQTRPTTLHVDPKTLAASFEGVPELNHVIRINDYSQSYKHWCVVRLALLSPMAYDVFFRLRFDLRATARVDLLRPILLHSDAAAHGKRGIAFRLSAAAHGGRPDNEASAEPNRFIAADRVHVGNFDIADFGFMGPPFLIEELSRLWHYCLLPPGSPIATFDFARSVTPREKYSEYNLMLWRIIFHNKWTVDSGGRYLWVSRYGTRRRTK